MTHLFELRTPRYEVLRINYSVINWLKEDQKWCCCTILVSIDSGLRLQGLLNKGLKCRWSTSSSDWLWSRFLILWKSVTQNSYGSTVYGIAALQLTYVLKFCNECFVWWIFFSDFFQLFDDAGGLKPFKKVANFLFLVFFKKWNRPKIVNLG